MSAPAAAAPQSVVPQSEQVTLQAKIKKIDTKTREIWLEAPGGEKVTVTAGPLVRLNLLKAGDTVNAKYFRSVAFAIKAPQGGNGTPTSDDSLKALLAQPASGPGGVLITQTEISGTVVAIDLEANRVSLVNPTGGQVFVFDVTDPTRQAMLPQLMVGDTITAVVSQMLAISVEPAKKRWW
jgi:predicted RNA-binding protein